MEEFISVKMDTPINRSIDVDLQNNSYNNDYNPRQPLVLNDQSLKYLKGPVGGSETMLEI
jgi:hypothetical protein